MKDGGDTPPPTGGSAVGGGLGGVALGAVLPGTPVGWRGCAAVGAMAGVAAVGTVANDSGIRDGTAVGKSAGSGMGWVAAAKIGTGVNVAAGAKVGVLGGTGVSVGARVGAPVGTADGGTGDGAAAGAAQATRAGKRRSAATTAHLNRVISTRYNFSFTCPPELNMIYTPHILARLTVALVIITLASCSAPDSAPAPAPSSASTPKPVPTLAATLAPSSPAAPAPTLAPTKPVKPTEEPVEDFTPKAQSVWDTQVGPDSLKGCSGGSILPAYGLVQMTPEGNTLVWKNQEPKPYTMTRVKPGVYAYEGPTAINDGTVKMVATFSGPTTVKMTRSFTPKAEAACVHTHEYTGVFKWETAPAATPKP